MSDEIKFSEAAQLFARNKPIVDAMSRAYVEEVRSFWRRLFEVLRELEPEWTLKANVESKQYWLQFQPPSTRKDNPFYWVDGWETPAIITRNEVTLYAAMENATDSEKIALHALANEPGCVPGKGGAHDLFRVLLKIGPETSYWDLAKSIVGLSVKMQQAVESAG